MNTSSRTRPRTKKSHHLSHLFLSPSSTLPYTSPSNPVPIPYSTAHSYTFPSNSSSSDPLTPFPIHISSIYSPSTLWHPSQNPSFHHLPVFPSFKLCPCKLR